MCVGSNDQDALLQLLDRGIGVVGVLRLVGLVRNEGMDLRGWDDLQLPAGIRVAGNVRNKIL
jgi:hypothetical protein